MKILTILQCLKSARSQSPALLFFQPLIITFHVEIARNGGPNVHIIFGLLVVSMYLLCSSFHILLVGGLEHFFFFHRLGIVTPTDELIFFRGVGIPPTSHILYFDFIDFHGKTGSFDDSNKAQAAKHL